MNLFIAYIRFFLLMASILPAVRHVLHAQDSLRPEPLVSGIRVRSVATAWPGSVRLARDPISGDLYMMAQDGNIYSVASPFNDTTRRFMYGPADHGLTGTMGMAFAPNGALYILANSRTGDSNSAIIKRGDPQGSGSVRTWTTVARTEPCPISNTNFDHSYNAVAISPDGRYLYFNSGSRTDHGEVEDNGGKFPNIREVPLTSAILRVPADAHDILVPADANSLLSSGYLFADGTRNNFELEFAPNGDLIGAENSGDRDDSEELNWLQEGHHYGFPWRIGTDDTPQRNAGYDPSKDLLINHASYAYMKGAFHNDPTYPIPPDSLAFTDPIPNIGPDAVRVRSATDGTLKSATADAPLATFTAHRSPLGLVFDGAHAMPAEYRDDAFLISWTDGSEKSNDLLTPMLDPGQDMLQLRLRKIGDHYEAASRKIVRGFHLPIDAVIIGSKIYVLDLGGAHMIWELDFSAAGAVPAGASSGAILSRPYPNPTSGETRFVVSVPGTQRVVIEARDILGNTIATLHDGIIAADAPQWVTFDGATLPDGVYIITARGETFHRSERISVVR
ncbi:MAG: Glucose/arabinose dehydrogenase, beta-propeller fold [Chlorobi bacterium]|nr:Glucose/arabinose dehydrogenase, beta-propeller fold [Chlorobiota bacterium]